MIYFTHNFWLIQSGFINESFTHATNHLEITLISKFLKGIQRSWEKFHQTGVVKNCSFKTVCKKCAQFSQTQRKLQHVSSMLVILSESVQETEEY